MEKYGTASQATDDSRPLIRRMRIACRITNSSDILSEYVICIAFPRQLLLVESVSI